MKSTKEVIASFLPIYLRCAADRAPASTSPAAVLFADVSGFTPLAARLAEHGSEGAEELNRLLNGYFGLIVDEIHRHGGDIIRFAGDAVLAIWRCEAGMLPQQVASATACGIAIQQATLKFRPHSPVEFGMRDEEIRLAMRITVAAGEISTPEIGGVAQKWHLLMIGQPWHQIRKADRVSHLGQVTLSPEAAAIAGGLVAGNTAVTGHLRAEAAVFESTPPDSAAFNITAEEAFLRRFVPHVVLERLNALHADYLADLRQVSTAFIHLPQIDGASLACTDQLQQVMTLLQSVANRWNGEVYQLAVDDKGTVGTLCFGLPHRSNDNNAGQALSAIEELQESLREVGFTAHIGVATGRIFCGPVGNENRREYTIHGSAVNLAARLMQAAAGRTLCDAATRQAARAGMPLKALPYFELKGFHPKGVPVFCLLPRRSPAYTGKAPPVGRSIEKQFLCGRLLNAAEGRPQVLLLVGEAGIGKSTLLNEVLRESREQRVRVVYGRCHAIERLTPYYAWRDVFSELLGLVDCSTPSDRSARILKELPQFTDQPQFAPLLNNVFDLNLPESDLLKQLSGPTRAQWLNDLLLNLAEHALRDSPLLIALEDLHWMDSASWALAVSVAQRSNASLIGTLRPLVSPPEEYKRLVGLERTAVVNLESLSAAETELLIQQVLGWTALAPDLVEHLHQRSQGNPLFIEELACYLRDAGRLMVQQGICRLVETGMDKPSPIPDTILDVITSRIDQLSLEEQLTLKTASVIGRFFMHATVRDVYPVENHREQQEAVLSALGSVGMIQRVEEVSDPSSRFRHVTIHDVAYQQLPVAQRARLHRAVAEWFESIHGASPSVAALLAHHWENANVPEKAIHFLAIAGDEAMKTNANLEAVEFFLKALRIHEQLLRNPQSQDDQIRRGCLLRRLAEARFNLGQLKAAQADLEAALKLFGVRTPATKTMLTLKMSGQILRQVINSMGSAWRSGRLQCQNELSTVARESVLAMHRLSHIHYFTAEFSQGLHAALSAIRLLESSRPSPELAISYANMSIVCGLVHMRKLAASYSSRARQIAVEQEDLPAKLYALNVTSLYEIGVGNWDTPERTVEIATEAAQRLGDNRHLAETLNVHAVLRYYRSQFQPSFDQFEALNQLALRSENTLHKVWSLAGMALVQFRRNRLEMAEELVREALSQFEGRPPRTGPFHGFYAYLLARLERFDSALQHLDISLELMVSANVAACTALEGYAGAVESLLLLWQSDSGQPDLMPRLFQAQKLMKRFSAIFPIARPRMWRYAGQIAGIRGYPRQARQYWRRSLREGNRLRMPFEIATTLLEIGRHTGGDPSDRLASLDEAIRLFSDLGTPWELEQADYARQEMRNSLASRQMP